MADAELHRKLAAEVAAWRATSCSNEHEVAPTSYAQQMDAWCAQHIRRIRSGKVIEHG